MFRVQEKVVWGKTAVYREREERQEVKCKCGTGRSKYKACSFNKRSDNILRDRGRRSRG
jgi:hypothetical protein